jgi:predicted ATPase
VSAQDAAAAEPLLKESLDLAREQQAKSLELRAATGLARLRQHERRSGEARVVLAPIFGWFTEGFDTPDLKDAAALLAELA